jgi:tetratricopeptide (TPR) repeat protein
MESFSASLKVKRRHYVESHLSVAETMHFLGLALIQLGKDEEASVYLESSLLTYESKLGTHSNIPEILDSLGSICISKKELDKAYRYLERSLALKRMVFEGDNMSISDTLYLIGKVQGKSGDLEDSLLTFKDGKCAKEYYALKMLLSNNIFLCPFKISHKNP